MERYRAVHLAGLPRFAGGAVGYAAYDAVRYTEHLPHVPRDDRGLPDLSFSFFDRMVIFDHIRKTVLVVAQAHLEPGADPKAAYETACARVDELVERLSAPGPELSLADLDTEGPVRLSPRSNFTREAYEQVVRHCQEYIKAGDIFQVVPSQRLQVETTARPFDIYRVLRVINPSPFLFYLTFDDFCLIGSSPEILVRVEDGVVTIRPLAGTRRRGHNEAEDQALAARAPGRPQGTSRAYHARGPGPERRRPGRGLQHRAALGRHEGRALLARHAHHLERHRPASGGEDGLRRAPRGPARRHRLRRSQGPGHADHRRGRAHQARPYAGAVGYIDFTGNMDTCIALRTLVIQGRTAYVQAGGGVVYDSLPGAEYEETVNKAQGLLKAIEIAETQL